MSWTDDAMACLVLDKYRTEEMRRLDEKAGLMRAGRFDDRAKVSDTAWRARNSAMLDTVLK